VTLTRRAMLTGCAAAIAPGLNAKPPPARRRTALKAALKRPDTLAYHSARSDILFGTFVDWPARKDHAYLQLVSRECSLMNVWGMAPNVTRQDQRGFDFSHADQLAAFAMRNELAICGGYLIDHGNEPRWITPTSERAAALAELRLIVTATMKHFAGQLDYWIVVNEAIWGAGLRCCTGLSAIGADYVAQAFTAARAADPFATLVYNDYGLEDADWRSARKRTAVLELLRTLRGNNVPIDALGIQGHLIGDAPFSAFEFDAFLDSVHDLGLKIVVTELDVTDSTLPSEIRARDEAVKQKFSEFLTVVLRHPGVTSINVWGLNDKHSWYNQNSAPPAARRVDGQFSRGALFDRHVNRKPAYFAVQAAFDEANSKFGLTRS
jgi:endo-1,4-beta-xylanase